MKEVIIDADWEELPLAVKEVKARKTIAWRFYLLGIVSWVVVMDILSRFLYGFGLMR